MAVVGTFTNKTAQKHQPSPTKQSKEKEAQQIDSCSPAHKGVNIFTEHVDIPHCFDLMAPPTAPVTVTPDAFTESSSCSRRYWPPNYVKMCYHLSHPDFRHVTWGAGGILDLEAYIPTAIHRIHRASKVYRKLRGESGNRKQES